MPRRWRSLNKIKMDSSPNDKASKLAMFDGKPEKFQLWWRRFEAYAAVHKFAEALEEDANMPETAAEELNETEDKKKILAKKRNDLAIAAFTMAFENEAVMSYIDAGSSPEWPKGKASLVAQALFAKYKPVDTMSKVEMRIALRKVAMKDNGDPMTLFTQLKTIEQCFQKTLDLDDKLATILEVCPMVYKAVLTAEQRHQGNKLTMVLQAMGQHYRSLQYGKSSIEKDGDNMETELSMAAMNMVCHFCKKKGHLKKDCFKLKKKKEQEAAGGLEGSSKKLNVNCNHCGKKGHKEEDCWEKPGNSGKRPAWYLKMKARRETGSVAVDRESKVEYVMAGVDYSIAECIETACMADGGHAFPDSQKLLDNPNFWIADTAASIHMTPHKMGFSNLKAVKQEVSLGDKSAVAATVVGDIKGRMCDRFGTELARATLTEVALISKGFNLFSCTKMQMKGWTLGGDANSIWLKKGERKIVFDIKITTPKGMIFAMFLQREIGAAVMSNDVISMDYKAAHGKLGHLGEDATKAAAKHLGWTVTGQVEKCESCEVAKAKQKSVPQETTAKPLSLDERRVHLDIAPLKPRPAPEGKPAYVVGKPFWRVIVDAKTQMKWSDFYATKRGMVEPTCVLFKEWKTIGKPVTHLRMDNAGENLALMERCKSAAWQLDIKEFELTARDTPQQNSLAEVAIATLYNRGRALIHAAFIPNEIRHLVFPKALATATKLDALVVVTINGQTKSRFEHFYGIMPSYAKNLRTWGEAGVVKLKTSTTPKMLNKGVTAMFVGYPDNHPSDCFLMYNPVTKSEHTSRDVIWLRRMFYNPPKDRKEIAIDIEDPIIQAGEGPNAVEPGVPEAPVVPVVQADVPIINEPENVAVGNEAPNVFEQIVAEQEDAVVNPVPEVNDEFKMVTRSGRFVRPPSRLIEDSEWGAAAPRITSAERNYYSALLEMGCMAIEQMDSIGFEFKKLDNNEVGAVGAALGGGFDSTEELKPMKYDEAMKSPDAEKWKEGCKEEYNRMIKHKVFRMVHKSELPKGAVVLSSTWAMKKKSNGTFRARLNGRGYEQIDGEHYDKDSVSSPTVNVVSARILLVLMILMCGYAHLVDVNGAFLLGSFEPDPITAERRRVFMGIPQGMEEFIPAKFRPVAEWFWELLRTLYGTKQAAKRFWLFLVGIMKKMGFTCSRVDPCVYFKWTAVGLLIWASWVDDCLHIGPTNEAVVESKKQFTSLLSCDDTGEMKEYVGCKIDYNREKQTMKFTQPVLLQSFNDEFILPDEIYNTPAAPDSTLQVVPDGALIDEESQTTYRSGVGKLLHLMRWSRPDILNAVREVCRFMGGANRAQEKALYRILAYCHSTPNRGLTLAPKGKWDGKDKNFLFIVRGKCDAEFAKDQHTRKSVGGHVVYLCEAPVVMVSRMERIVAISVTEAELIQAADAAQDMLYVWRFLKEMGLKVELPMILECDNSGAVDITNNWASTGRTRHIDVRFKFMRELKEAGILRTVWTPSDTNEADINTKNVHGPLFEHHIAAYVGHDEYAATNSKGEGVDG